jgi:hypothetical protein
VFGIADVGPGGRSPLPERMERLRPGVTVRETHLVLPRPDAKKAAY